MILYAIQSKLATLRDMNNSGNIDCVKMDVILDELSFDTITDGITIEF